MFLAAADHLLMAAPRIHRWYEANLTRGINVARWIEYSISASLMILLIGLLTGINNLYAMIAIFGVNASMILFGLVMEQVNTDRTKVNWWPFVFGCIAGIVPWIIITTSFIVSSVDDRGDGDGVPFFVYVIFVTLFLLFNCFALNQWLQYRGKGKFADYLYGEKVYLVLSLVAKTALGLADLLRHARRLIGDRRPTGRCPGAVPGFDGRDPGGRSRTRRDDGDDRQDPRGQAHGAGEPRRGRLLGGGGERARQVAVEGGDGEVERARGTLGDRGGGRAPRRKRP